MIRIFLGLALWALLSFGAAAQNVTCANRPIGSSDNACANTRFVATAIASNPGAPGGSPGQIQYNNAGILGGFTVSGDFTITPSTGVGLLASVNSNVGSFGSSTSIPNFTVDAKGRITAAGANAVIAPAGTLTGTTLAANVVNSSLTGVGTITSGIWNAGAVTSSGAVTGTQFVPTGSGIPTNGVYLPAANTLGLATNGVSRLQIDGNGNVGIGASASTSSSVLASKNITGSVNSSGVRSDGAVQSDVTSVARGFLSAVGSQATSFSLAALNHFEANQGTFGAGSTVSSQRGFFASSALTGGTNNYGFFGDIAAATGRYNLYMNGTADNYLAGSLGIGSTGLSTVRLRLGATVTGGTTAYASLFDSTVLSGVTGSAVGQSVALSTQAASFTVTDLRQFFASQGVFGAGSTVTNQYGFQASSTLTGATNNFAFHTSLAAAAGRWAFYGAGTARSWFGGNVGHAAGSYINFGTTDGSSGYGFFDNAGTMQVKNSGGAFANIASNSGTLTNGNCVSINASGQFVDAGGPCTTGGGGGTVSSSTINQVAYYTGATTVAGTALNTTATPMYLKQVSSGPPAMAQIAFTDLSQATQTANRVWAGPTSGAAATPTFRALVAADVPTTTMIDAVTVYGLVGDDSTNNDTAITAMITAINSTGAQVYIRPGIYRFNSQWTALNSVGGGIICSGSSSVFRDTRTSGDSIVVTTASRPIIQGCLFKPVNVKTSGSEILVNGPYRLMIDQITCQYVYRCITAVYSTGLTIQDATINNVVGDAGIYFLGTSASLANHAPWIERLVGDNNPPLALNRSNVKGNYANSTAYVTGDTIVANSRVWQAQNSGISAVGGAGPNALPSTNSTSPFSTNVTDGTVNFRFLFSNSLSWVTMDSYSYSLTLTNSRLIDGWNGVRMLDSVAAATCGTASASCPWWIDGFDVQIDHAYSDGAGLYAGRAFRCVKCWSGSSLTGNGFSEGTSAYIGETLISDGESTGNALNGVLLNSTASQGSMIRNMYFGYNNQAASGFSGVTSAASVTNWSAIGNFCGPNNGGSTDTQQYCVSAGATNSACKVTLNRVKAQLAGSGASGMNLGACTTTADNY